MKFHCARCKTRYSISDERVSGKILKIRCKNCSGIITVREGGERSSTAPAIPADARKRRPTTTPSAADLESAFVSAMSRSPGPADADDSLHAAPATLDAEWYVSVAGVQEGPFSLEQARAWVADRDAQEDVYCWSEGFDDWLSIAKVSHFRGLRKPLSRGEWDGDERTVVETGSEGADSEWSASAISRPRSPGSGKRTAGAAPPTSSAAPEGRGRAEGANSGEAGLSSTAPSAASAKLSAAPLGELSAARDAVKSPAPALFPDETSGPSSDLEFDIGEASRIFQLPLLAQQAAEMQKAGAARPAAAPGTSAVHAPPLAPYPGAEREAPAAPTAQKNRQWYYILGAAALTLGGIVALLIVLVISDSGGEDEALARAAVGGGGNLGFTFRDSPGKVASPAAGKDEGGEADRRPSRTRRPNRPNTAVAQTPRSQNFDEVDLFGSESGAAGPLDGNDLMKVYRANQYLMKRCYERALKKDPFLKVPKTWVTIRVGTSGTVDSVSIPNLAGSPLGTCLTTIISKWKFRKTSEVFDTRFPVVFN